MQRNGLLLPLTALALAAGIAALLALDFRKSWEADQARRLEHSQATLDGIIQEDEYTKSFHNEATGMELYWTIRDDEIFIGLRCPSRGWVALGLGGQGPMMKDADILIAYVDAEGVHAQDNFANDFASHVADIQLGGRDDILESAGTETGQGTVVELRRKLDTGDPYDQRIVPGKLRVLLAHADADDFTSYHKSRFATTIDLFGFGEVVP